VILQSTKVLPDGTCIVAAVSRERKDLPVFKNTVRGQLEPSGWVIQPFPDKPGRSMVTFVCSVDLAGLSSTLVNLVAKQPLVIAGLRKVLAGGPEESPGGMVGMG
jgi:hypothetical protein